MNGALSESIPEEMLTDPAKWAEQVRRFPVMTRYVQPGHSLCLGDNSPQSSDSRYWGLVPDALMIGPVTMRYWPWSRAGEVR
jgi:type IV secretory pathway protease TraF